LDQPGLGRRELGRALAGLARLNWWSGSSRPFRRPLEALASSTGGRPVRVLDVASGGGDVPVALASWAFRRGFTVKLTLCDMNAGSVDLALRRAAFEGISATGLVQDLRSARLPAGFDTVISSLFLHHLEWEQAVAVLQAMAGAADRLLVVCDLRRTAAGLALAAAASRLLTRSAVVHTDAVLSVRAAFTLDEVRRLAREAGLAGARVDRCWPQRWRLSWWRF